MADKTKDWLPTEEQIQNYSLLREMLLAQKREFAPLSSKKPNENLNKMKIKMVNRVLVPLKQILEHEESYKFLDTLQEDDMPTNSDTVLIISQFETAILEFKKHYYKKDEYKSSYMNPVHRWITKEYPPEFYAENSDDSE